MKRTSTIFLIPAYVIMFSILFGVTILTNQTVSTVAENQAFKNRICFIIDPGHGGEDGGATSCSGVLESELNLQISQKLDDLMHFLGLHTVMTRNSNRSIYTQGDTIAQKKVSDLKERVRIVNNLDRALLISIHQNHYSNSRYYGPQVFYSKVGESEQIAVTMQNALVSSLCPESNRKVKKASGIYLLDRISNEGILIECGFISNHAEEAKLRNDEYQKKLCAVIASVCTTYAKDQRIA